LNDIIKPYETEIRDIKHSNGECVIARLQRKDVFDFRSQIINCNVFRALYNDKWNKERLPYYISKGLNGKQSFIEDPNSEMIVNNLYSIQKVYWGMLNHSKEKCEFIFINRPWFSIYKEYANNLNIKLIKTPQLRSSLINIIKLKVSKISWGKYILKYIRNKILYRTYFTWQKKNKIKDNAMIFFEGLGEFNLTKDGNNSDFFFYLYSPLEAKNLSSQYRTFDEREQLLSEGIYPIFHLDNNFIPDTFYKIPKPNLKGCRLEEKALVSSVRDYFFIKSKWKRFFEKYNTKIFLSWFKFDNHHIAIHDAINQVGGFSAIWERSFEGEISFDLQTITDIYFCPSKQSAIGGNKMNNKISYYIIVGFLRDYSRQYLVRKAKIIRNKLKDNGAKKIVAIFDQNSADEYTHERERGNYYYILETLFKTPWLGVVFKPKKPATLRMRMGTEVSNLIDKAIETGRCHLFEEHGLHQSNIPLTFPSLIADVCVHGSLYAGTAAVECALLGRPTLLVDRVGYPSSRLYELEIGKVIFHNWPDLIKNLIKHFTLPNGIPGFGDWSEVIDDYDPYRDGKGAYRMGSFMKSIIDNFELGLDRDEVLENAADIYGKKWGYDKIISF